MVPVLTDLTQHDLRVLRTVTPAHTIQLEHLLRTIQLQIPLSPIELHPEQKRDIIPILIQLPHQKAHQMRLVDRVHTFIPATHQLAWTRTYITGPLLSLHKCLQLPNPLLLKVSHHHRLTKHTAHHMNPLICVVHPLSIRTYKITPKFLIYIPLFLSLSITSPHSTHSFTPLS